MEGEKKGEKSKLVTISTTIPVSVKRDIINRVDKKKYNNISDFLRKAVYKLLEDDSKIDENLLDKKSMRDFIEKLS